MHPSNPVELFTYHATQARCYRANTKGLVTVVYSGPLCIKALLSIAPQVLRATCGAQALMVRLDGCLMAMGGGVPVLGDAQSAPGCLIVRADQFDAWSDYGVRSARLGVRRIVFLDSQIVLAQQWLARRSLPQALPVP